MLSRCLADHPFGAQPRHVGIRVKPFRLRVLKVFSDQLDDVQLRDVAGDVSLVTELYKLALPRRRPLLQRQELRRKSLSFGGEGGIRTHGGREPSRVFKTLALNRSATSPIRTPRTTLPLLGTPARSELYATAAPPVRRTRLLREVTTGTARKTHTAKSHCHARCGRLGLDAEVPRTCE